MSNNIFVFIFFDFIGQLLILSIGYETRNYISEAVLGLMTSLFSLFLLIYFFGLYRKENIKQLNQNKIHWRSVIVGMAAVIILKFVFGIVTILILGEKKAILDLEAQSNSIFNFKSAVDFILIMFQVGILSPVFEELFYRGIIFNKLRSKFNLLISIIVSSIVFGLVHVYPALIIWSFLIGITLCLFYVKTKNIIATMFLHSAVNLLPFILMLISGLQKLLN